MQATYPCSLEAFPRCFDVQSVDLLLDKIKSSELDPYATLDKFVSWLTGNLSYARFFFTRRTQSRRSL